jgi:two-component system, LytTR family, response regulator
MIPLVSHSGTNNDSKVIVLSTSNGVFTIDTSTIIHIRSISNYSKLFFSDGKTLTVAKVLAWFEDRLPSASFVRTHRSHIISLQHIQAWCDTGNGKIILCNETIVDVSRRKRRMVLKVFRSLYAA